MSNRILVFYGSYRSDRMGIRLAEFIVKRLRSRGDDVELIDAKAINLPMLDRMYKDIRRAKPLPRLKRSRTRSAPPTASCSSPANTIGASSPA
jgi:NAD(P)H-dependent FMN reductase